MITHLAALGLLVATTLFPAAARSAPAPSNDRPKLTLQAKDAGRSGINDEGFSCALFASASQLGFGYDAYLEEVATVLFSGSIDCDAQLQSVSGDIALIDRSPNYNGESLYGRFLDDRAIIGHSYGGSGGGQISFQARTYNGGRFVEPMLTLFLMAPIGFVWGGCSPGFLLRVIECSGEGSSFLFFRGVGLIQSTGLTAACRDQLAPLDPEEARLALPSGSPFSTQILNTIPSIRDRVTAFKRDLCNVTSAAAASSFAMSKGQQLWAQAVAEAKNDARQNDDRPLYWARLSMTMAMQQWKPAFFVDDATKAGAKQTLDWAARGIYNSNFTMGRPGKVFVSGFDPFGFNVSGITVGNPSAASVLRLDDTLVNNAEVQVVVFPVRYKDFDAGIVETATTPHVQPGPQQATLITTVSQGGNGFELEVWNGRNRSLAPGVNFPDNRDVPTTGTYNNPVEPLNLGAGEQFVRSTLPMDRMQVGSPYSVVQDASVWELAPAGPQQLFAGPSLCPLPANPLHPCYRAIEGSGGGFLSNEVAYRVTALRDRLAPTLQAGHIHTPLLSVPPDPFQRNNIVGQYRQILQAAIG